MLGIIVFLLAILWFLGYIDISGINIPNTQLFVINGTPITLVNLLMFILVLWAIGILPGPLRTIGAVLLILWVLATLNIIAFAGLSSILTIAIIGGLVLYLLGGKRLV